MKFEKINPDENVQKRVWNRVQSKISAENQMIEFADNSENVATVYTKKKSRFLYQFASVAACMAIIGAFVFVISKTAPDEKDISPAKLTSNSSEQDVATDWQSIKVGWTREDVHNSLGEPNAYATAAAEDDVVQAISDTWHFPDGVMVEVKYGVSKTTGNTEVISVYADGELAEPPIKNVTIVPVAYDENTPLGDGEWELDYAVPLAVSYDYDIPEDFKKRVIFHNSEIGIFVMNVTSQGDYIAESLDLNSLSDNENVNNSKKLFIRANVTGDKVIIKESEDSYMAWIWSIDDDRLIVTTDTAADYGMTMIDYFDKSVNDNPNGKYEGASAFTNPLDPRYYCALYVTNSMGDTFSALTYVQDFNGEIPADAEPYTYYPDNVTYYPFDLLPNVSYDTAIQLPIETGDISATIQNHAVSTVPDVVSLPTDGSSITTHTEVSHTSQEGIPVNDPDVGIIENSN